MTRRVSVLVDANITPFTTSLAAASAQAVAFSQRLREIPNRIDVTVNVDQSRIGTINTLGSSAHSASGRTRALVEAIGAVAPAAVPIGAVAVPAVSGLASALGFAAVAGVGLVTAFQGVGDALKYVRQAELDPTTEHIEKAQLALQSIGEDAALFVFKMRDMSDEFARVRDQAAKGLFPGMVDSLDELQTVLPRIEDLFFVIGDTLGDIARDATESLVSDRWAGLIDFLKSNVRPELERLARIGGDLAHGMAEMWQAFQPLNDDFLGGLERMADTFDRWTGSLSSSRDFAEFVAYVREAGPDVREAFVAIAVAMLDIAQAAAPIGGVVLDALQALAEAISAIAESDLGTPLLGLAVGMAAVNRSLALTRVLGATALGGMITSTARATLGVRTLRADLALMRAEFARLNAAQALFMSGLSNTTAAAHRTRQTLAALGKSTAVVGGLALATSGAAEGMGLTNTATLALMGTLGGSWGTAVGAGTGLLIDFSKAGDDAEAVMKQLDLALESSEGNFSVQREAIAKAHAEFKRMQDDFYDPSLTAGIKHAFSPEFWDQVSEKIFEGRDAYDEYIDEVNARTYDLKNAEDAIYRLGLQIGATFQADQDGTVLFAVEDLSRVARRAAPAMAALGLSVEDLANMDDTQLANATRQIEFWLQYMDSAPGKTDRFIEAVGLLGEEVEDTATSAERLKDALDAILDPNLDLSEARDAWHEALQGIVDDLDSIENPAIKAREALIDALEVDLSDAGTDKARDRIEEQIRRAREELEALREAGDVAGSRALFGQTEGARENRAAIRDRVELIKELLVAEAEAGASPEKVARIFESQTQALEDVAVQAGLSREDVRKYQRQLGLTPDLVRTTVEAIGLGGAKTQAESYWEALDRLNGKTVTSYVSIEAQFRRPKDTGFGATGGDGSFADGGWTGPGSKYQPAGVVHAEEFVVKRGPAAAYRPWLERLNRLPGYANGGFVQAANVVAPVSMPGFDYDRIAAALLNVRPLYGDVHMQPHNYDQFRRQMEDDRRAASVGGRPL